MEILEGLLSSGRTSRFYRRLVEEEKIAAEVSAANGWPGERYPNLFVVFAAPRHPHTGRRTGEGDPGGARSPEARARSGGRAEEDQEPDPDGVPAPAEFQHQAGLLALLRSKPFRRLAVPHPPAGGLRKSHARGYPPRRRKIFHRPQPHRGHPGSNRGGRRKNEENGHEAETLDFFLLAFLVLAAASLAGTASGPGRRPLQASAGHEVSPPFVHAAPGQPRRTSPTG